MTKNKIIDPNFAKRLEIACNNNSHVPAYNYGRLKWIVDHLKSDQELSVSMETVRKWYHGEARPRPDKMVKLSKILDVDDAWLTLGKTPVSTPSTEYVRTARATGAVNLVAGYIALDGGHSAFPEHSQTANLFAIAEGRHFALHVTIAQREGHKLLVSVPQDYENCSSTIVVVPSAGFKHDLIIMSFSEITTYGIAKGGYVSIEIKQDGLNYRTRSHEWNLLTSLKDIIRKQTAS